MQGCEVLGSALRREALSSVLTSLPVDPQRGRPRTGRPTRTNSWQQILFSLPPTSPSVKK
eukprot:15338875-Alexandrium_andersonii.AAC.1